MDYIHTFIEYQRPFWMDFAAGSRKDPNINQLIIKHCLLPIPPQEEQRRIVTKLNQLYPYINQYGNSQNRLNQINKEIWHNLKKSILKEAIQGKLVPQIAEEGIAQDLLEQIRQEKQKLVKEGKLKKSALTDSVIYKGDDNGHYPQLPDGWVVVPMQMLCSLTDGEKLDGKEMPNLDVKYLRGERDFKTLTNGRYVAANSLLILVDGENSGEVFRTPIDGYQGSTFKQLYINKQMLTDYVLLVINLHRKALRENKVGSAIPHLNKKLFKAIQVPIPPYNEQRKIVDAVETIFKNIDAIMENL